MAISLPSGFLITAKEPIDNRLVLTKAEMLATVKARMPDKYICLCKDDNRLYIYDKSIETPDPEIGRFKLYEAPVDANDMAGKLPAALTSAMSTAEGAESIANALFDSEHFEVNLDNKIDLAVSLIQAIDSN